MRLSHKDTQVGAFFFRHDPSKQNALTWVVFLSSLTEKERSALDSA